MEITKIDDTTIQVTPDPVTTTPPPITYTKDELLAQRDAIQAQKDEFDAARQAELDQVNALLAACDDQGVMTQTEYAAKIQAAKLADPEAAPAESKISAVDGPAAPLGSQQ
jgi:hypothetical protein